VKQTCPLGQGMSANDPNLTLGGPCGTGLSRYDAAS
jgi:hypothetical protein